MTRTLFQLLAICWFMLGGINSYSQINNNSLFLLIEKDSLRIDKIENGTVQTYKYENEENNWAIQLHHSNVTDYIGNHYRLSVPTEMMDEFIRRGNVQDITSFFRKLDTLDMGQVSDYFRLFYPPYFFEYLDGQRFSTHRRWNIF